MALNIQKYEADLEKLLTKGREIYMGLLYLCGGEAVFKIDGSTAEGRKLFIDSLPDFKDEYQTWFSEASALVRQLLPDRLDHFVSYYEIPKNRREVTYVTYVIADALRGLRMTRGYDEVLVDHKAAVPLFEQQLAILKSAKARFSSSLFEIRQLVQADVFDSEIASARELLKMQFVRAAGAVAGVVLEKHLQQVAADHKIAISKKHPTIADLNDQLKGSAVIDIPQWRHISFLGDIRNLCDHAKTTEPTIDQVKDLIDGVNKVLKTIA